MVKLLTELVELCEFAIALMWRRWIRNAYERCIPAYWSRNFGDCSVI